MILRTTHRHSFAPLMEISSEKFNHFVVTQHNNVCPIVAPFLVKSISHLLELKLMVTGAFAQNIAAKNVFPGYKRRSLSSSKIGNNKQLKKSR